MSTTKVKKETSRINGELYRFADKNGPYEKQVVREVSFYGTLDEVKNILNTAGEGLVEAWFSLGIDHEENHYVGMKGEPVAYVQGWAHVEWKEARAVREALGGTPTAKDNDDWNPDITDPRWDEIAY